MGKYVDHPAPSVVMVVLLVLVMCGLIAVIPGVLGPSQGTTPVLFWVAIASMLAITAFYFWPFYSTYYTVSSEGIEIRYGPWSRRYPWSDFSTAYWQKGMFATRIGWPSVTPCVRLTNAVLLKRKSRGFGLYLTPNDPQAFLRKVAELAPALTAETII
ncbi:MAG: hypothetical protein ACRENN_08670 [Candidatus Eiseniibacteriota bacterium]